jgi:hypothetical protein
VLKEKEIAVNREIIALLKKSNYAFKEHMIKDCKYRIAEAEKGILSITDHEDSKLILEELNERNNQKT